MATKTSLLRDLLNMAADHLNPPPPRPHDRPNMAVAAVLPRDPLKIAGRCHVCAPLATAAERSQSDLPNMDPRSPASDYSLCKIAAMGLKLTALPRDRHLAAPRSQ